MAEADDGSATDDAVQPVAAVFVVEMSSVVAAAEVSSTVVAFLSKTVLLLGHTSSNGLLRLRLHH